MKTAVRFANFDANSFYSRLYVPRVLICRRKPSISTSEYVCATNYAANARSELSPHAIFRSLSWLASPSNTREQPSVAYISVVS